MGFPRCPGRRHGPPGSGRGDQRRPGRRPRRRLPPPAALQAAAPGRHSRGRVPVRRGSGYLATIHGDVALQLPLDGSKAPVVLDTDEYGTAKTSQPVTRYSWLGAKQRSAETPAGHSLMGVRLYDSAVGRFLSIDPVQGGGDNRYGYPGDPVNQNDLDGRAWKCKAKCQLAGSGSQCSGYVWGAGSGANEDQAVKDAKRDAVNQAPRGCYARHCKAYDCTKNRARQWWDGNYNPRTMHGHNAPNWMRSANYYSLGIPVLLAGLEGHLQQLVRLQPLTADGTY
nr:hypothetical protein OG409_01275 [Streptomyces sp. NBC_00974]